SPPSGHSPATRNPATRPPPRLGDLHPRYLDRLAACDHAFGMRARQASADQLDHLIDREAMGEHYRLGASVAGHGEQFERPTAIRLGAVATATGLGHGVVAAGGSGRGFQGTTPRPAQGGPPSALF